MDPGIMGDQTPDVAPESGLEAARRAFEEGILVGVLVGEGHFGGDGKQPQVTLRMHTRHEALFLWIQDRFPGGALYGPYHHAGRSYYQWMARGRFLRDVLVPILERRLDPALDAKAHGDFAAMRARYRLGAGSSPLPAEAGDPHHP